MQTIGTQCETAGDGVERLLVLVEMVVPKPTPAKSTTGKSAPKPIRAAGRRQ